MLNAPFLVHVPVQYFGSKKLEEFTQALDLLSLLSDREERYRLLLKLALSTIRSLEASVRCEEANVRSLEIRLRLEAARENLALLEFLEAKNLVRLCYSTEARQ